MPLVYVGIGTNLGDRHANVSKAIDLIQSHKEINIIKKSSIEETDPVDFLEQPAFLNQIICVETQLTPEILLDYLQSIEQKMGREKIIPKGPRIIDLDIILYDDLIMEIPGLKIPHPEIVNRQFILKHLTELNPELLNPVTGFKYSSYLGRLS